MKLIAINVFRLKHGKRTFVIKSGNERNRQKMIKHFGEHIWGISLELDPIGCSSVESLIRGRNTLKIIIEKCSQTLKELTISDTYDLALDTPFQCLETLNLRSDNLTANIHASWFQYSLWFPSLRNLLIDDVRENAHIDDTIVGHIPTLVELCLFVRPNAFTVQPLAQFINLNRHINTLKIWIDNIRSDRTNLLSWLAVYVLNLAIKWEFLNVTELDIELGLPPSVILMENVAKLDKLKFLKFNVDNHPAVEYSLSLTELFIATTKQDGSDCIDFISKHKLLKKLTIKTFETAPLNSLRRIAHNLKDLNELTIYVDGFKRTDATHYPNVLFEFVRHCKALRAMNIIHIPKRGVPKNKRKMIRLYKKIESKIGQLYKVNEWKLYHKSNVSERRFRLQSDKSLKSGRFSSQHFNFVNEP